MIELLPDILTVFARGGGGGSGGSSGGGGGEIIAMIGYFPSYYTGKFVKKLLPRKAELVVSFISATLMSSVLLWLAYVAHGGFWFMFLVVLGIWSGWYAAFFDTWDKIKKRAAKTKRAVDEAALSDTAWQPDQLLAHARQVFAQYQQDWSDFNVQSMQGYVTRSQLMLSALMLRALREMGRVITVANLYVADIALVDMHDSADDSQDWFRVAIEASANDTLRDTRSGQVLFTDKNSFTEYWTFVRHDDTWLLDRIDQATADLSMRNQSIESFAHEHNFYYMLDMGWLFLPNKGVLFGGGRFGKSDINNYTVGLIGEQLVQLYTYTPTVNYNILVGQINLPKSYEGILVRRKPRLFSTWTPPKSPRDYQKHSLEWPDFNKRYEVSATNADRLATFELLNPGFMAYLYDTDPGVSIEVADNVVYLYKFIGQDTNKLSGSQDYDTLMIILTKAHKELQL